MVDNDYQCYIYLMSLIIFISPSKTFSKEASKGLTTPLFQDKTSELEKRLAKLSKEEIGDLMRLSKKLAEEVHTYFHQPSGGQAIKLYAGVQFKAMDVESIHVTNENLYIVDAFYGLVRPLDHIHRYRLDFTMSIVGNLYQFWIEPINKYLHNNHAKDTLIDLTSQEFAQVLPNDLEIIRIDFVLKSQKISNVLLKQMRGKMAREIIHRKVKNIEDIQKIKIDGFVFNPQLSLQNKLIFMR